MTELLPPRCRHCQGILTAPGVPCAVCGRDQEDPSSPATISSGTSKSLGLAIFLTLIWMGAGHLYVGKRPALGASLMAASFVVLLVNLTGIGLLIGVPISIGLLIYALLSVHQDLMVIG